MSNIQAAMAELSDLNKAKGAGTQDIKGKTYTKVAARVEVFRTHLGLDYGLDTQISDFQGGVLCKAYVTKGEEVIGSGHAYSTGVSQEKGLEKLESTAIGRAMASIGLSGGEYASVNEMESWEGRYEKKGIYPLDKTGNKSVDGLLNDGLEKLAACKEPDELKDAYDVCYKEMKTAGCTEEQLGVLRDQKDVIKGRL